jgi:predicted membrane protein
MSDFIAALQQHPQILQLIGVVGFSLYITAFTLLQTGRICGNSVGYTCFVITAASCVLISLITAFNLAAFLIQASYVCIGLFGLARRYVLRRMRQSQMCQSKIRQPLAHPEPLRQSFAALRREARDRRTANPLVTQAGKSRAMSQAPLH